MQRLSAELAALAPWADRPLRTIFVGGGTPSLLRVDLWQALLGVLQRHFDLSEIRSARGEFTVECNPETVTPALMDTMRAGGVNRVSIGAQSFNAAHLKTLERWHDPANVPKAIDMARAAGIARASIDLIFAIPGQTLAEWEDDLRTALSYGLDHVSAYALTFEPATAMTARLARGEFSRADEDLEADMFIRTREVLLAAGLDAYEVSNFALPGQECRHNLAYWRQESWLAAGPSASGHLAGVRWKNAPRLDDYLGTSFNGFAGAIDVETPDAARALTERLMTGLRLREGLDATEMLTLAAAVDAAAPERLRACVAQCQTKGHLRGSDRWAFTESGILIADRLIVGFMAAIRP